MAKKTLYKSNEKVISGVLGGIAEYFEWDKSWVRLIGAILIIFPGQILLGVIIYFIAAAVIPEKPSHTSKRDDSEDDDSVIEGEFHEK